jgi:hypothetical protein
MSRPNPKRHRVREDGTNIYQSNHLGDVVDVGIDLIKRCFYGIREDGTRVEVEIGKGNNSRQKVMLYNMNYDFETNTWRFKYHLKVKKGFSGKEGFKTAIEAWLCREELIASGIAER